MIECPKFFPSKKIFSENGKHDKRRWGSPPRKTTQKWWKIWMWKTTSFLHGGRGVTSGGNFHCKDHSFCYWRGVMLIHWLNWYFSYLNFILEQFQNCELWLLILSHLSACLIESAQCTYVKRIWNLSPQNKICFLLSLSLFRKSIHQKSVKAKQTLSKVSCQTHAWNFVPLSHKHTPLCHTYIHTHTHTHTQTKMHTNLCYI